MDLVTREFEVSQLEKNIQLLSELNLGSQEIRSQLAGKAETLRIILEDHNHYRSSLDRYDEVKEVKSHSKIMAKRKVYCRIQRKELGKLNI